MRLKFFVLVLLLFIFLFKTQNTNAQITLYTPNVDSTSPPVLNYCTTTTNTYNVTFSWSAIHDYTAGTLVYELKYSTDNGATYITLPDIPNPPASSANVETNISLSNANKLSGDSAWAVRSCNRQLSACSADWNWGPPPADYNYACGICPYSCSTSCSGTSLVNYQCGGSAGSGVCCQPAGGGDVCKYSCVDNGTCDGNTVPGTCTNSTTQQCCHRTSTCSLDGDPCQYAGDCCNSGLGASCVNGRCLICAHSGETCGGSKGCCQSSGSCTAGVCKTVLYNDPNNQYSNAAPPPLPCDASYVDATTGNCKKVATGLGFSIKTDVGSFITSLLGVILSISGGIAVLLIIISGYRLMISQGNPEKIQAAREQLTAAIVGLLFIIFSLVIIQVLGYDILHIPGFGQ